ncbi:MAG: mechanosensitive ion channel family protein [Candidatus Woesearchaeota archaeon]
MKSLLASLSRSRGIVLLKVVFLTAFVGWYVFQRPSFVLFLQQATVIPLLIAYFSLTFFFSLVRIGVVKSYLTRRGLSSDHVDNFTLGMRRLASATAHFIFVFVLLHLLGIRLGQLFTSISIFVVGIVLLTREYILNFVNGAVVLFTDKYRINDFIKVGDIKGRIVDVSFQSIELITEAGEVVYVPNSVLVSKEVFNLSKRKVKSFSEEVVFLLVDEKKLAVIEKKVSEALQSFSEHVVSSRVFVSKVDKETCTVTVSVRVKKYSFELEQRIRKAIIGVALAIRSKEPKKK